MSRHIKEIIKLKKNNEYKKNKNDSIEIVIEIVLNVDDESIMTNIRSYNSKIQCMKYSRRMTNIKIDDDDD